MLSLKNISHDFLDLKVLDDISLDIDEHEIVSIMGPSGCGKSTLLKIIAGLIPSSGVHLNSNDVAFVFQDDRLLPWCTTFENIAVVRDDVDCKKINSLIEDVGLAGFENYKPDELSGGMKKRCGVARAFYYDSSLLLMDEPFSGLDYYLRKDMLKMLLRVWSRKKPSIVFVTHEVDEALEISDRIIVLSKNPAKIIMDKKLPGRENRILNSTELDNIRHEILSTIEKL